MVPWRASTMTVNLTRIYTKLGDGGETHLGDMSRVPKTHPRIAAYGTLDELNAQLGVALAMGTLGERFAAFLRRIQNDLFDVGADISVPHGGDRERLRLVAEQTTWLEEACDELNPECVRYLNRLSDLLFILARAANEGEEPLWEPGRYRG